MKLYIYISRLILVMVLMLVLDMSVAQAQKQDKIQEEPDEITLVVSDQDNIGIPGVEIVVGEGILHLITDENGKVTFEALKKDVITVNKPGYDKQVLRAEQLISDGQVTLHSVKFLMTAEDNVQLPFTTLKKRHLVGSTTSMKGSQLESYPNTDLRTTLSGQMAGLLAQERTGAPGLVAEEAIGNFGAFDEANLYVRGLEPLIIIDGLPRQITEIQLDAQEIESVTLIKDITGKAMFGPAAANGILYITSKRGKKNERQFNASLEHGISTVDRFPEWVDGVSYAQLNNQARINDGLSPLYDQTTIDGYAAQNPTSLTYPSNLKYPNNDFRSMMLKDNMPFTRVNVSSSGGNEEAQYFAYLGYAGEGDLYKLGYDANFNRINARSNMDVKLNKFLKLQVDFYGQLTLRNSPNYGYDAQAGEDDGDDSRLDLSEFTTAILDMNRIPTNAFPVYANFDEESGDYWYGVSSQYGDNPIANITENGYYTETGRTGLTNLALDYDMSSLIPGLSSRTFASFDVFNLVRIGKATDYTAYIVEPQIASDGVSDTFNLVKVHSGVDQADEQKLHDFYYNRFGFYQTFTYDHGFGNHYIKSTLTYYLSKYLRNQIEEPQRQQNVTWMGLYSFKDKINVQGVLNYAGTYSFDEGERYKLFPSVGVSYILSDEAFMSGIKFLDYLKLRVEGGQLGYEGFASPFAYRSRWNVNSSGNKFGPSPVGQWFGKNEDKSVYRTSPNRIGNPDIGWEIRKDFSTGFDALFFNKSVYIELTYYNNVREGQITYLSRNIPEITGLAFTNPRANFNSTRYTGVETAIQYTHQFNRLSVSVGGNATFQNSELLKYDELNYPNEYQKRTGKPANAFFGLTYIGKFADDADVANSPYQVFDDQLHGGDLKYADKNGDGQVDSNDLSMVGNTTPNLFYGLNLRFGYRNFELKVIADGASSFDVALTSQYFQNGSGDNLYSKFVQENVGGAYPRLTYNRVNNNFLSSDFWLTEGDYFKIQNVELAYSLPQPIAKKLFTRGFRVYVRGANLYTFTKVKYIDPEGPNAGVYFYPLMRTITGGINLTF